MNDYDSELVQRRIEMRECSWLFRVKLEMIDVDTSEYRHHIFKATYTKNTVKLYFWPSYENKMEEEFMWMLRNSISSTIIIEVLRPDLEVYKYISFSPCIMDDFKVDYDWNGTGNTVLEADFSCDYMIDFYRPETELET